MRTYEPDAVDGKLHGLPVLSDAGEWLCHVIDHPGQPCLISVASAQPLTGLPDGEFAGFGG